jgi:diadenosine tetraphosphate (Ap4A) HIT family hydrolase
MMTYDDNNIFAKIIKGQALCDKIYEDEDVLAFFDAYPVAPVHALVIPKGQYLDYADFLTREKPVKVAHFFATIKHVSELLKLESFRIITNKGEASGQSVFHFHVHILSGKQIDNLY